MIAMYIMYVLIFIELMMLVAAAFGLIPVSIWVMMITIIITQILFSAGTYIYDSFRRSGDEPIEPKIDSNFEDAFGNKKQ